MTPATTSPARVRALVVGGGVSGLVAADVLADRLGSSAVAVVEAARAVGGLLRACALPGSGGLDAGAESLLARRPEAVDLVHALGLGGDLTVPATSAARILHDGVLHPVPPRTLLGVPGDPALLRGLLDDAELARVAAEPTLDHAPVDGDDVPLADLVAGRLGDAVLRRLVEPLLAGVYAGRVERLGTRAVLAPLWPAVRDGRSLVDAARAATASPGGAGPPFVGLRGGVHRLADAAAQRLRAAGVAVENGVAVRSLAVAPADGRGPARWVVELVDDRGRARAVEADGVLLAVPAPVAARLLRPAAPLAASALAGVETADVAVVAVRLPPGALPASAGSGVLVAGGQLPAVKAVTFSSRKWGWVADTAEGADVVRLSMGRAGDGLLASVDDDGLVRRALADLARILQVYGGDAGAVASLVRDRDVALTRWPQALPQYGVGHGALVREVTDRLAALPAPLALAGSVVDGVGVAACIATARRASGGLASALGQGARGGGARGPGERDG